MSERLCAVACKLRCRKCGLILREEGDAGKSAEGQYRVYDSVSNSAVSAGTSRIVECLACGSAARISEWDGDEDKPLVSASMELSSDTPADA